MASTSQTIATSASQQAYSSYYRNGYDTNPYPSSYGVADNEAQDYEQEPQEYPDEEEEEEELTDA
jgi:hypothetical protein